jgi:L-aspartate oxidase
MPISSDTVIEAPGALILGAGVAGLFTALKLAPFPALVVAGAQPGTGGSSAWAQGGVAAALGESDSWEQHAADTMAAGAGLCDAERVAMLAREAPERIEDLLRLGVNFDRELSGKLALGLEAAHSRPRIVHVQGDRAGAAITQTLAAAARATPSIAFTEGFHVVELAMQDGQVAGLFARARSGASAKLYFFRADSVVIASGGLGALYAVTTNPAEARGEGLGMAARAGALIADPEFVQFHPTALAIGRDPAPLATEALRGAGATLINEKGVRFMQAVHPDAELAPRDIVARAIQREIARGGRVFLDGTKHPGADFATRFPTVYAAAQSAGIDPVRQPIPVAPAAHYHMGGIATGEDGRSSLPGLWALGECASTGVHGANRLASNSLLEALVFGARVAEDIRAHVKPSAARGLPPAPARWHAPPPPQILRDTMSLKVGMARDAQGLREALAAITAVEQAGNGEPALLNMTASAKLVAAAALQRRESRGAHFRTDYPQSSATPTRSFLTLADADRLMRENDEVTPATGALDL